MEAHALVARRNFGDGWSMPRPCAVESHARCYKKHTDSLFRMPRPCAVEPSRSLLQKAHRLSLPDATALRRGASRSPLLKHSLRKTPLPDVLTNLRAGQITVAADIETRLPEPFNPRRNERSANLFLRRVQ